MIGSNAIRPSSGTPKSAPMSNDTPACLIVSRPAFGPSTGIPSLPKRLLFFRMISSNSRVFFFASFGDCLDAFAASSNVLSVMFFGFPMSSSGFPQPQL